MLIGIDASRAFTKQRTGTENYTWHLVSALSRAECQYEFVLYLTKQHSLRSREETQFTLDSHRVYDRDSLVGNVKGNLSGLESSTQKIEEWVVPLQRFSQEMHRTVFKTREISWPFFWTQGGLALETWLRSPDLLFIPAHVIPFLKNPSVPTIVTVHDLGFEFLPWYQNSIQRFYLSEIVEKLRARLTTHIIAVSKATKNDLMSKLKVPNEKISVVYEGVDHRRFAPKIKNQKSKIKNVKRKYNINGDYILFVGTIQPRKNLVRLIEAFAQLINQRPDLKDSKGRTFDGRWLTLVLAGKRGWSSEEIYKSPKKFGINVQVRFLDYVSDEDLPTLYAGAICFCLPSLHEGFGLPVLEAMASGIPVVVSRVSSLPEVAGEAAVFVDPYDVLDIAEKLRFVIENNELREKLRRKGFDQMQKFSWEKCAKETAQVFNTVLAQKGKL